MASVVGQANQSQFKDTVQSPSSLLTERNGSTGHDTDLSQSDPSWQLQQLPTLQSTIPLLANPSGEVVVPFDSLEPAPKPSSTASRSLETLVLDGNQIDKLFKLSVLNQVINV